jgi:hypothetical protein
MKLKSDVKTSTPTISTGISEKNYDEKNIHSFSNTLKRRNESIHYTLAT